MRVTDSLRTDSLLRNVEDGLNNYNTVQQQISTGKKLNSMSDDPIGGTQDLALQATLVDNAQYQTNADAATSFLSASDGALSSANDLINSASRIAVQAASGIASPQDLQSLGDQVDSIISQLTTVANTDLHGKYLFGGTSTQTPPFVAPAATPGGDPTPTYVGNSGNITVTIGKSDSLPLNSAGNAVFGGAFTALQTLRNDIKTGTQTAISADIDKVNAGLTTVDSQRAATGARMNEVSDIKQRLTRSQGDYQAAISNIEDVDLAQAYVQLQSTQNVYQAALLTTSQSFKLSLTNYIQ